MTTALTLVDQIGGPGGDLIGLWRALGAGASAQGEDEARRALTIQLQTSQAIGQALERFHGAGYRGALVMGEARLFEALGRRASASRPSPLPIVPNLQGFMRDAVEHGMVGAGLRRAWRVGPLALAGLGLRGMGRAAALARRDFPTMLQSFVELELADFARYDPPVVFLQAQMTDLAVAMRNPRILEAFFKAVSGRTGAAAALATANFGQLVAALKSWGMETAAIVAPWSASGAQMRPDPEACAHAARACEIAIWADWLGRMEAPASADRAAAEKAGLAGFVRDDLALWLNP